MDTTGAVSALYRNLPWQMTGTWATYFCLISECLFLVDQQEDFEPLERSTFVGKGPASPKLQRGESGKRVCHLAEQIMKKPLHLERFLV